MGKGKREINEWSQQRRRQLPGSLEGSSPHTSSPPNKQLITRLVSLEQEGWGRGFLWGLGFINDPFVIRRLNVVNSILTDLASADDRVCSNIQQLSSGSAVTHRGARRSSAGDARDASDIFTQHPRRGHMAPSVLHTHSPAQPPLSPHASIHKNMSAIIIIIIRVRTHLHPPQPVTQAAFSQ